MRFYRIVIGVLVLSLSLSAGPALAQENIPIRYGQSLDGTITAENYFFTYQFDGSAGDVVTIEMIATSGDLDPFVGLFGPDDELLLSNDDIDRANQNYDARIEAFALPVDGRYVIGATRFNVDEGTTTGTYRLTLVSAAGGGGTGQATPPDFGVQTQQIAYNQNVTGAISEAVSTQYYVFLGDGGDLISGTMTPAPGVTPLVRLYDAEHNVVSRGVPQDDGSTTVFFAVPATGWYLVEVASQSGYGTYEFFLFGFPGTPVTYGDTVSGQVTPQVTSEWYIFEAGHGDTVTLSMTATGGDLVPYIVLGDINLNDLGNTIPGQNPATMTYTIPRAGRYVILASREGLADGTTTGTFTMTVNGTALNPATLAVPSLGYGSEVTGTLSDANPVVYYSFQGKGGDLVTINMNAVSPGGLDPYLILADADFNTLTVSDDTGTSSDAQVFQYTLPDTGLYYILATRAELTPGLPGGDFTLGLTIGEVQLTAGAVEATLRWDHTGDVDLFVIDPNDDAVGFDSPQVPSGGILEVDTNGNCETLTPLPVEHIYWPQGTGLPGVYTIVVRYQLDCENRGPVTIDLSVLVGGQEIAHVNEQLARGQRYRMSITVNADGTAFSNNDGAIDTPTQESARAITYGQTATGTINDQQYFVTYRFSGQAGDAIVIAVDQITGDLDPVVGLFDAQNERLAFDDDSGGNRNSRLAYTLPTTGDYTIAVSRYQVEEGTTSGEYRLTLTRTN